MCKNILIIYFRNKQIYLDKKQNSKIKTTQDSSIETQLYYVGLWGNYTCPLKS